MARASGACFVMVSPVVFAAAALAIGVFIHGGSARSHAVAFGSLFSAALSGVLCLAVFAGWCRKPMVLAVAAALAVLAVACLVPELIPC